MITERDRDRLYEVFDLLAKADTMPEQLGRLVEVNDEIVNDPESSDIALAVAAVALDGVTHSAADDENVAVTAGATFAADAAGLLLGSTFGLAGGIAVSVVASVAAESAATS
jgi:hypothetical protein